MKNYQNILLGVELISENDAAIVQKAVDFAKLFNAKLTLIHVIERISSYGPA